METIALISLDIDDFRKNVVNFGELDKSKENISTKRKYVTSTARYFSVSRSMDCHSVSFDKVLFTENAIYNPELIKIIETIRPCVIYKKKPVIVTIEDAFKEQKENIIPYTKEMFEKIDDHTYHNGDPLNIGDYVYYGFVEGESIMENNKPTRTIILIKLKEEHFPLYEFVESVGSSIPVIKLK